jgi:ABC-type multidrug transport system ATPase subunit
MFNCRETLNMAAALRLPKNMPAEEKEAAVADLIQRLGLVQSADTPVGVFFHSCTPTSVHACNE